MQYIDDIIYTFSNDQNSHITELINTHSANMGVGYYSKNRAVEQRTAKRNIEEGKKGEFFAAHILHENFGFPLIQPDCDVFSIKDKSWAADLISEGSFPSVHVKTCTESTLRFCDDYSWTFQWNNANGKNGRDNILSQSSSDVIVFIFIPNYMSPVGTLKAIIPCSILSDFLEEPRAKKYVGIKKCVYYSSLVKKLKKEIY